jgi:hypothetical protein
MEEKRIKEKEGWKINEEAAKRKDLHEIQEVQVWAA